MKNLRFATEMTEAPFIFGDTSSYLAFARWWKANDLEERTAHELIVTPAFGNDEERLFCLLRWR